MQYNYAIAITGGIAVGKSTFKTMLYLYGYQSIDADDLSHQILDDNYQEIANMFGDEFVDIENKKVLRKKLAKIVFSSKEKLNILQDFLHPKIQEKIEYLAKIEEDKKIPYFIDIPLFYENKNYDIKNVLVVYTPKQIQIQRLMLRDKIDYEYALQKVNLQIDIEEKKKKATFVVDNSQHLKHLEKECDIFVEKLREKFNF